MYRIILDEGVVLDMTDTQVAPCQSTDEPSFLDYISWVNIGNQPEVLETRS